MREQHRRKLLLKWTKIYPWVATVGSGEDMIVYCRECRKFGLKNEYTINSWKKEYLQRHASSEDHVKYAPMATKTAQHAWTTDMFVLVPSASEKQTLELLYDIDCSAFSYRLAAQIWQSFTFILYFSLISPWSQDWIQQLGIHAINQIWKANFFSLLTDESNDHQCYKTLVCAVCWHWQWYSINKYQVHEESLSDFLWCWLMIMSITGGAPVMLGCNSSVHIWWHCVAHREALAVSQAYKSVSYFVQLKSTLWAIYSLWSFKCIDHSSVWMEKLKQIFAGLEKRSVRVKQF